MTGVFNININDIKRSKAFNPENYSLKLEFRFTNYDFKTHIGYKALAKWFKIKKNMAKLNMVIRFRISYNNV